MKKQKNKEEAWSADQQIGWGAVALKNIRKENHNFEVMICILDQRLSSLVTNAWGSNTFPVRKKLLNPHFQNPQTIVFLVFLTFFSNKHWWLFCSFSPLETNTLAHPRGLFVPPPEGRLRQLATLLGMLKSQVVQSVYNIFITTSLFTFPLPFYPLFCPYLYITFAMFLCWVCVCLSIIVIVRNAFFYIHMTPTPHTHIEMLGPIPGSM